jgi:hypothetical protein
MRFYLIGPRVDLIELLAVQGSEETASRRMRRILKRGLVEHVFADGTGVTNRDGVNDDSAIPCNARRIARLHLARRIIAIGQGDHRLMLHRAFREEPNAETYRIAECSAWPCHTRLHLIQKLAHEREVGRKWNKRKRRRPENHDADAIPLPLAQEVPQNLFDRSDSIDGLSGGIREILCIHRGRQINEEQQIARGLIMAQRRLDPLGTHESDHDQYPAEHEKTRPPKAASRDDAGGARCLSAEGCYGAEEGDSHSRLGLGARRSEPPHQ